MGVQRRASKGTSQKLATWALLLGPLSRKKGEAAATSAEYEMELKLGLVDSEWWEHGMCSG